MNSNPSFFFFLTERDGIFRFLNVNVLWKTERYIAITGRKILAVFTQTLHKRFTTKLNIWQHL